MDDISLDTVVSGSIAQGQTADYAITIPAGAKYVVELGGAARIQFGIWEGPQAVPPFGKLRVCGLNAWGTRMLNAGRHTIRVTGMDGGTYPFKVRRWSFSDYWSFWTGAHPSTC